MPAPFFYAAATGRRAKAAAAFQEIEMSLNHSCPNRRHPLSERGSDLYSTPSVATEALLGVEQLPNRLWEPAAGRGNIVRILRAHGHMVFASDFIDYGSPAQSVGCDFLLKKQLLHDCGAIVTNPPFKLAEQFIAHALELAPAMIVMLLRLAFLESERRRDILENCGLARVHVFHKRLPMMHRDNWAGSKASSAMSFAWFILATQLSRTNNNRLDLNKGRNHSHG
jgi:hypothetical protein